MLPLSLHTFSELPLQAAPRVSTEASLEKRNGLDPIPAYTVAWKYCN